MLLKLISDQLKYMSHGVCHYRSFAVPDFRNIILLSPLYVIVLGDFTNFVAVNSYPFLAA